MTDLASAPVQQPALTADGDTANAVDPTRRRVVEWSDPSVITAAAPGLSGIELLGRIADGTLPPPPVANLIGMDIESLEIGHTVFGLTVGEHQYNPIGSVHGGVISTVLDSALGCAIHSTLAPGQGYTTLELKVNFDRALTTRVERVRAEAEVVTVGAPRRHCERPAHRSGRHPVRPRQHHVPRVRPDRVTVMSSRSSVARAPRNPWLVLGSTSLAVFAVFLDTTILFVAFPSISESFSSSDASTLSWVLNAYTIAFAASLIPAGRLADRVGRRRTFLLAVVAFTLASMLCGLAPALEWLIALPGAPGRGRGRHGAGVARARAPDLPQGEGADRRRDLGAVGAVAGAAGPTLGALVVENFGWRWAFFINLPVGIISLTLGTRVLPEGRESNPGPDARPARDRPAGGRAGHGRVRDRSRPGRGAGEPRSC